MANRIQVPTFTPVETENQFTLSSLPARYLGPLLCNQEIAVITSEVIDAEGYQNCRPKEMETSMVWTVLKVVSYFLSAGILPLLACMLNILIRCGTKYQFVAVPLTPPTNPQRELPLRMNPISNRTSIQAARIEETRQQLQGASRNRKNLLQ